MTKQSPKIRKISKSFSCKYCIYNCSKNSEFEKHLNTAKHKRMTKTDIKNDDDDENNTNLKQISASYNCVCGKKYKYRQGLHAHKKKCIVDDNSNNEIKKQKTENQDNVDYKSMFLDAMSQNKEIMELLKEQSKTVQEQSKTMHEQSKTMQEMAAKVGNNNTTNNNKFNLQVFLNEECKDAINFSEFIENIEVTEEDLENQAQLGYVSGISKLFLENLKELGATKRPIHCTDKKRNTLYIKEDNEWDKEGSQDQMKKGIFKVQCKTFQRLCAIKDENQEEYSDMDSDFSVKCLNIQRHLTTGYQRETTIGKIIDNVSTNSTIDREP